MNCFRPATTAWIICFLFLSLLPARLQAQLRFVPNVGQWPEAFHYRADVPGGAAFLEDNKIWYNFSNGSEIAHQLTHPHDDGPVDTIEKGHAIALEYVGASQKLTLTAEKVYPTLYNYYIGSEQYWRSGLLASADIRYKNLYDGIDMLLEGGNDVLKYTFFLKRGADPSKIQIRIIGASSAQVVNGALRIITTVNEIREDAPKAWQWEGDKKIDVPCRYVLRDTVVSFEFPDGYNPRLDLVIDPFVVFASYSGSIADNFGYTATYDDLGHAYGGGDVWAQGYPVTTGAYQKTFGGNPSPLTIDAGIMKFSPDGKKLLYATYLGGSSNDRPHSMIVNSDNELIVLGTTVSPNFPWTKTAYDTILNGYDIFISRFSSDGSKLLASTLVGGAARDGVNEFLPHGSPLQFNYADEFRGEVIIDPAGDVYVASTVHADNFPTTPWSMQPSPSKLQEAVVFRMDKDLSQIKWGTFIGGTGCDAAYGMQFDSTGNLYVCGGTTSQNLFQDSKMYQDSIVYSSASQHDSVDAFVCHITGDSGTLINATYFGTSQYDQSYFVQVDTGGFVYLYGQTRTNNFPLLNANYVDSGSGQFIAMFNPALDSLILSTLFGSGRKQPDISPTAFLVDNCGKIYISGWGGEVNQFQYGGNGGSTKGMKVTPDAFQKNTDTSDFYIAVFARMMDTLLYASFFGNPNAGEHVDGGTSRFDKHAVVYQSVCGSCDYTTDPGPDPITTVGAHSRINKGKRPGSSSPGCNNLVLKLDVRIPDITAEFTAPSLACKDGTSPVKISFKNVSKRGTAYEWDFGDGDTSKQLSPDHVYKDTGTFTVRLVVLNPNSCSLTDTFYHDITVKQRPDPAFAVSEPDCDGTVYFQATGSAAEYNWDFGDGSHDSGKSVSHLFDSSGTYTVKLFTDTSTVCNDSSQQSVIIKLTVALFTHATSTCDLTATFQNASQHGIKFAWDFGDAGTDTAEHPVHTYKSSGSYTVSLTITSADGCTDTFQDTVTVIQRSDPGFVIKKQDCDGTVHFEGTGLAVEYHWDFGDGTYATGKSASHRYNSFGGTYMVRLYADTASLCGDSSAQPVAVRVPIAQFTYSIDTCKLAAKFKNTSFHGVKFVWEFGDNTSDTVENPVHAYAKPGTYNVQLTITDTAGCTNTFKTQVSIIRDIDAGFSYDRDTCSGKVTFTNTSKDAQTFHWIFGDGTTNTARDPIHYFTKDTVYTVVLIAISGNGCRDTTERVVEGVAIPESKFTYQKDSCSSDVKFKSEAFRGYTASWDFGDGSAISKEWNPTHAYEKRGTYTVRFIINQGSSCADTVIQDIYVARDKPSAADLPNVFTPNGDLKNDFFVIEGFTLCYELEIEIYNRWGQLVYEEKGNPLRWDGRSLKGEELPAGVYYYIFRDPKFGEKQGTVTMLRE